MRLIITLIFVCCGIQAKSQLVAEKLGRSEWMLNDTVLYESTLAFIQRFNENGKKEYEWQIYRKPGIEKTDTNYVYLDTLGRMTEFRGFGSKSLYEYSEFKNPTKTIISFEDKTKDSLIFNSTFELDSLNRIIKEFQKNKSDEVVYNYEYNGNLKNTYIHGRIITKEVTNGNGEWILLENYDYNTGKLINRNLRIIDSDERIHYYAKFQNGELKKETEHFYNLSQNEEMMIEYFPNKNLKIVTRFEYKYW